MPKTAEFKKPQTFSQANNRGELIALPNIQFNYSAAEMPDTRKS